MFYVTMYLKVVIPEVENTRRKAHHSSGHIKIWLRPLQNTYETHPEAVAFSQ